MQSHSGKISPCERAFTIAKCILKCLNLNFHSQSRKNLSRYPLPTIQEGSQCSFAKVLAARKGFLVSSRKKGRSVSLFTTDLESRPPATTIGRRTTL